MRRWPLVLALCCGCTPKVPPHLAIDPEPADEQPVRITDLASAIEALVRHDPLARAPALPDPEVLEAIDGGAPLADYVRTTRDLEAGEGEVERVLGQLEDKYAGTAVVALTRGYRLRVVENMLATTPDLDEPTAARIAVLLTPLHDPSVDDPLPRGPLEWVDGEGPLPERLRRMGDRWVLAGWLADPGIPLEPVGRALQSPVYDGLADTPTGALVLARATAATADPAEGRRALQEATRLALLRAAADRDREQAAWAQARDAARDATGADDPVAALLRQAARALTANAADDRDAGGALLALGALRWEGACAVPPCAGFDRVQWMATAERWSDEIAPAAAAWQALALKQALDDMEVGHDTVRFPLAIETLVDALIGTGAGPLELSLVRRRAPAPQVWLELSRAVGTEGVTDWAQARVALGRHLQHVARHALALDVEPAWREPLQRIADRAIP